MIHEQFPGGEPIKKLREQKDTGWKDHQFEEDKSVEEINIEEIKKNPHLKQAFIEKITGEIIDIQRNIPILIQEAENSGSEQEYNLRMKNIDSQNKLLTSRKELLDELQKNN